MIGDGQLGLFEEEESRARVEKAAQWSVGRWGHPAAPTDRCAATVEERILAAGSPEFRVEFRGCCLGSQCDWRGRIRREEGSAVEDAHDHAWSGWRDLPMAIPPPATPDGSRIARWAAKERIRLAPEYPAGWIEAGGAPQLTPRSRMASRHVPLTAGDPRSIFGGYDMAVVTDEEEAD